MDPQNQNSEKMKKNPEDIIILQMCTINDSHMTWSATDRIFVILDHFLPFNPQDSPKNQIFKKMKKMPGDIIILHMYTKNYD